MELLMSTLSLEVIARLNLEILSQIINRLQAG